MNGLGKKENKKKAGYHFNRKGVKINQDTCKCYEQKREEKRVKGIFVLKFSNNTEKVTGPTFQSTY